MARLSFDTFCLLWWKFTKTAILIQQYTSYNVEPWKWHPFPNRAIHCIFRELEPKLMALKSFLYIIMVHKFYRAWKFMPLILGMAFWKITVKDIDFGKDLVTKFTLICQGWWAMTVSSNLPWIWRNWILCTSFTFYTFTWTMNLRLPGIGLFWCDG